MAIIICEKLNFRFFIQLVGKKRRKLTVSYVITSSQDNVGEDKYMLNGKGSAYREKELNLDKDFLEEVRLSHLYTCTAAYANKQLLMSNSLWTSIV